MTEPASVGSAVVAGVALIVGFFLLILAVRVSEDRWPRYAFAVCLVVAAYSILVFLQYNSHLFGDQLASEVWIERLQLTSTAAMVAVIIPFFNGFLRRRTRRFTLAAHTLLTLGVILLWIPEMGVQRTLVSRRFVVTGIEYTEPALGWGGMAAASVTAIVAVIVVAMAWRRLPHRPGVRRPLLAGTAVWLAAAANDALGSFGVPVPHYILEYGFLVFVLCVAWVAVSKHLRLHRLAIAQRSRLRLSNEHLARAVDARTRALAASLADSNRLLQEVQHRTKNNLQIMASLLRLASFGAGGGTGGGGRGELRRNYERVMAMATAHDHLFGQAESTSMNLEDFVRHTIGLLASERGMGDEAARVQVDVCDCFVGWSDAVAVALWVSEALADAMDRCCASGRQALSALGVRVSPVAGLSLRDNAGAAASLEITCAGEAPPVNMDAGLSEALLDQLSRQVWPGKRQPPPVQTRSAGVVHRLVFPAAAGACRPSPEPVDAAEASPA